MSRKVILNYDEENKGYSVKGILFKVKRNIIGVDDRYPSLSEVVEKIKVYDEETGEDITDTIHPIDKISMYIYFSEVERKTNEKTFNKILKNLNEGRGHFVQF